MPSNRHITNAMCSIGRSKYLRTYTMPFSCQKQTRYTNINDVHAEDVQFWGPIRQIKYRRHSVQNIRTNTHTQGPERLNQIGIQRIVSESSRENRTVGVSEKAIIGIKLNCVLLKTFKSMYVIYIGLTPGLGSTVSSGVPHTVFRNAWHSRVMYLIANWVSLIPSFFFRSLVFLK